MINWVWVHICLLVRVGQMAQQGRIHRKEKLEAGTLEIVQRAKNQ